MMVRRYTQMEAAVSRAQVSDVQSCKAKNTMHYIGVSKAYLGERRLPVVVSLWMIDYALASEQSPVMEKGHVV